jgi:hypothetical protein
MWREIWRACFERRWKYQEPPVPAWALVTATVLWIVVTLAVGMLIAVLFA